MDACRSVYGLQTPWLASYLLCSTPSTRTKSERNGQQNSLDSAAIHRYSVHALRLTTGTAPSGLKQRAARLVIKSSAFLALLASEYSYLRVIIRSISFSLIIHQQKDFIWVPTASPNCDESRTHALPSLLLRPQHLLRTPYSQK